MGVAEIILLAVGLSMDAFTAALCKGIAMKKWNAGYTVIIGGFFGAAQALMPVIGWFLGSNMKEYISAFDHWIAFLLLGYIGGKMIYDAFLDKKPEVILTNNADIKEILILSAATSIDALAAGITLAFLNVNIVMAVIIIGCTTFMLSCVGVCTGYLFGSKFEKHSSVIGGSILILIGIKTLIEHLI